MLIQRKISSFLWEKWPFLEVNVDTKKVYSSHFHIEHHDLYLLEIMTELQLLILYFRDSFAARDINCLIKFLRNAMQNALQHLWPLWTSWNYKRRKFVVALVAVSVKKCSMRTCLQHMFECTKSFAGLS